MIIQRSQRNAFGIVDLTTAITTETQRSQRNVFWWSNQNDNNATPPALGSFLLYRAINLIKYQPLRVSRFYIGVYREGIVEVNYYNSYFTAVPAQMGCDFAKQTSVQF